MNLIFSVLELNPNILLHKTFHVRFDILLNKKKTSDFISILRNIFFFKRFCMLRGSNGTPEKVPNGLYCTNLIPKQRLITSVINHDFDPKIAENIFEMICILTLFQSGGGLQNLPPYHIFPCKTFKTHRKTP